MQVSIQFDDFFQNSNFTYFLNFPALASAGARVGSLSSPLIAMLDVYNPVLPLVVYGIIVLLAGLVSLWLWPETKSRKLPETMDEAEKVAATKNPWVHWC